MIFAVFLSTIFNHLVAARILNIDIDIRHRNTIWVKEALEQQAVFQRIEIGDIQRVGNNRTSSRAAPRPKDDSLRLTPVDKILDDQKVAFVAHVAHHTQLHLGALAHFVGQLRDNVVGRQFLGLFFRSTIVALQQTLIGQFQQI